MPLHDCAMGMPRVRHDKMARAELETGPALDLVPIMHWFER